MNLLVADGHAMFRDGLQALLERGGHQVVGAACDGRDAVRLARESAPDIALLDLDMPVLNGVEAARQIARRSPATAIIMLTGVEDDARVIDALRAGARGYVLKAQCGDDLLGAIAEVARGAMYLSPGVSRGVVDACLSGDPPPVDPLTEREREVLQLVAEGLSTREIADLLAVSIKTAESHRTRLMRKLDLHNVAGLVRYAVRRGLIQA
jgi:two-component system, NarL family, response regulator NreC